MKWPMLLALTALALTSTGKDFAAPASHEIRLGVEAPERGVDTGTLSQSSPKL